MLVLSRRIGEVIVIDDHIRVYVTAIDGGRVRLGISAPATVRIDRQEVHARRPLSTCRHRPSSHACRAGVGELCNDAEV
jgi:carbon storage regulator